MTYPSVPKRHLPYCHTKRMMGACYIRCDDDCCVLRHNCQFFQKDHKLLESSVIVYE